MGEFNIDSKGLTRMEFLEAIHRFSLRFFGTILAIGFGIFLVITAFVGFKIGYLIFPGSIVVALILYFEMKAQSNYMKFDYMGTVLHFRFTPEGWAVIRNNEIHEKGEFTWAETEHIWQTPKTILLCPSKAGVLSYTLPKRSLTPEQLAAILAWHKGK